MGLKANIKDVVKEAIRAEPKQSKRDFFFDSTPETLEARQEALQPKLTYAENNAGEKPETAKNRLGFFDNYAPSHSLYDLSTHRAQRLDVEQERVKQATRAKAQESRVFEGMLRLAAMLGRK